jgi:sugar lactone lactonase YvrE
LTPPPIAGKGKYIGAVSQLSLPAQTAWFKIDSTSPITGFELFGTTDGNQLAAYAGGGGTGTKSGVFAKIEKDGWTGIAFVNTEATAASVTLTAYTDAGAVVAAQVLPPVPGHAKVVDNPDQIFSQDISGATYITYSSDRNVVGFQLNGSSDGMMLDGLPGLDGTNYPFSKAWGSAGAGDGQFNFFQNEHVAAGVAVDGSGNVYVADWANNRIQKFDSNGNFLAKWGSMGTGAGQFYAPIGIAIAPNGDVLVTESGNCRVQRFTAAGAFVVKWGSRGTDDGQFMNPNSIAVTPAGTIYVADTFNHRIQKFDSNGNFLAKWGSQGTGDGRFMYVYAVAVSPTGKVYAGDTGNHRIQVFDGSGVFQGKFGAPDTIDGQLINPIGLAFDADGNLFVADIDNNRIVEYDPANAFVRKWGSPGTGNGQFYAPYAVAVDSSASVYVADTVNNRIQKFVRVP